MPSAPRRSATSSTAATARSRCGSRTAWCSGAARSTTCSRPCRTARSRDLDPEVIAALRLGAYQLLYMDGVADHAAVTESVDLAKEAGSRGHGLVNAVLRRTAREGAAVLARPRRVHRQRGRAAALAPRLGRGDVVGAARARRGPRPDGRRQRGRRERRARQHAARRSRRGAGRAGRRRDRRRAPIRTCRRRSCSASRTTCTARSCSRAAR